MFGPARFCLDDLMSRPARPQQLYFSGNLFGGQLMVALGSRQVKESISITVDRASVSALETGSLGQFDPVGDPTSCHELSHSGSRAMQIFFLWIFSQRRIDAFERSVGRLDFFMEPRPLLSFVR